LALPENQTQILNIMTYDDGRTLQSEIDPAIYEQLINYFSARSIPEKGFQKLSIVGVSLTMTMLEYQLLGMKKEFGVENYFTEKLLQDNKKVEYLESASEQIGFISTLQLIPSDKLINQTLNDLKEMPTMIKDLKSAWRSGDLAKMESLGIKPLLEDYPEAYEIFLKNRNEKWVKKIETMLKTEQTEYVLVGALHLAGKDGLIEQLKNKGYTVKQIE